MLSSHPLPIWINVCTSVSKKNISTVCRSCSSVMINVVEQSARKFGTEIHQSRKNSPGIRSCWSKSKKWKVVDGSDGSVFNQSGRRCLRFSSCVWSFKCSSVIISDGLSGVTFIRSSPSSQILPTLPPQGSIVDPHLAAGTWGNVVVSQDSSPIQILIRCLSPGCTSALSSRRAQMPIEASQARDNWERQMKTSLAVKISQTAPADCD